MKIKFGYNMQKVDVIKACPDGRQYNKKGKHWEVPNTIDNLKYLLFYASLFDLDKDQLKSRIKEMVKPLSTKNEFNIDWRCKPYKHQEHGLKLALNNDVFFNLYEMGLGKTLIAMKAMEYRLKNKIIDKALVVCPKTVLYSWEIQVKQFSDLKTITITGNKIKRSKQLKEKADIYLINYDLIRIMEKDLKAEKYGMIVLDESQFVKNYSSKRSRSAYNIATEIKYRILLTGSPISTGVENIFSQFKILDETIFGSSFYSFRNKYFVNVNQYYPDWKLKPDVMKQIKEKMSLRSHRLKKTDVLDLPDKIFQVLHFEMPPEQRRIYKDMKSKMVAIINDETVNVTVLISKLMKLTQICSGFYMNDGEVLNINDDKVKELKNIVENNPDEKIVVWTVFKYSMRKIQKQFPDALTISGDVKQEDRNNAIDQFQNNPDKKMIILQIQAGSTGITLTASNINVYYERNYNFLDYIQSNDRTHRVGTVKNVLYINLVARDSIDEIVMENLARKQKLATEILDLEDSDKDIRNIYAELKKESN